MTMQENKLDHSQKIPSCAAKKILIQKKDLPVSCPTDEMILWNAHPRVFLPLGEGENEVTCPYCDTIFVLENNG